MKMLTGKAQRRRATHRRQRAKAKMIAAIDFETRNPFPLDNQILTYAYASRDGVVVVNYSTRNKTNCRLTARRGRAYFPFREEQK